MAKWCDHFAVNIWAYCLMPNHVHLIAVPEHEKNLCAAIGETHRRYTLRINSREGWQGHLWQGRFRSCPMDERHLLAAVRYIELNPVRAGLVEAAEAYPWSSAAAHIHGREDRLVDPALMAKFIPDWRAFLATEPDDETLERIRKHENTGRPLGSEQFVKRLEADTGRDLKLMKRGKKVYQDYDLFWDGMN